MEEYVSKEKTIESIPFVLAINKVDLLEGDVEDRKVSQEYFDNFAKNNGFEAALRTSATDDINVHETFEALLKWVIDSKTVIEPKSGKKQLYLKKEKSSDMDLWLTLNTNDKKSKHKKRWW